MFNEGRENVHDEARNGRPSLVNDDLVRKVNERVRDDIRFTISDLFLHFAQISRTLLFDIVSSNLGYRKVCGRLVPMMLTEEHKKQRVLWHFWCAIIMKETACWGILWQETRHGCPISHMNQNSSRCTGSILAVQYFLYVCMHVEQHHDLNGFCESLTFQVTPVNVRFEIIIAVLLNFRSCGLGRRVDWCTGTVQMFPSSMWFKKFGRSKRHRRVGAHVQVCTASYRKSVWYSSVSPWELQISQNGNCLMYFRK